MDDGSTVTEKVFRFRQSNQDFIPQEQNELLGIMKRIRRYQEVEKNRLRRRQTRLWSTNKKHKTNNTCNTTQNQCELRCSGSESSSCSTSGTRPVTQ